MAVTKLRVTLYVCERCEHRWIPRDALADEQVLPTICPKCKSPYWNKERVRNPKARKKAKRSARK